MFTIIASLFAGPAGVVTAWFTSLIGKIVGILAIVGVIAGLLASVYFSIDEKVKYAEDAKLKLAQQAELVKAKDAEIKQLHDIADVQASVKTEQDTDNKAIDLQTDSVNAFLAQRDKSKDGPASQVLKDTVDRLSGAKR